MIRALFFLVVFSFSLSSKAFYEFTERELKEVWKDSQFNSWYFNLHMKRRCHISGMTSRENSFSACMMALHHLIFSITKDKPMQIQVSPANKLEIVPYSEGQIPETPGDEAWNKRRNSFIAFFLSQIEGKTNDQFISVEKEFDDILAESLELLGNRVPNEDQAYYLGASLNKYIKEIYGDPYARVYPRTLSEKVKDLEYSGVGVRLALYGVENDYPNGLAINPFKGSQAEDKGLGKGDLILAVNGVPVRERPLQEIKNQILFLPEDHSVELTVQSFCNDETRDIKFTSKQSTVHTNIIENSHFINIQHHEPFGDCDNSSSVDKKTLQALYVPIRIFLSPTKNPDNSSSSLLNHYDSQQLCHEFVQLQEKDLENKRSLGMIIDLRGNFGGHLHGMSCMLNTLVSDTDIILKQLPVEFGKIIDNVPFFHSYFTNAGPINMDKGNSSTITPISYNKNIVVLVDEETASVAELFAGIIQDKNRGWLVGDRTMGKGSSYRITSDRHSALMGRSHSSAFNMTQTTVVYTFGNDRSIQGVGVVPDFRFSNTGEPIEDNDSSMKEKLHFRNIKLNTHWNRTVLTKWQVSRPVPTRIIKSVQL